MQQPNGDVTAYRQDQLPQPPQPPAPALPTAALAVGAYQLYVLLNNSMPTLTRLMVDGGGETLHAHERVIAATIRVLG